MLQQTTVQAVIGYFERFTRRWPSVLDLAQAKDEDVMAAWAGLGYYARARNLLKCARTVVDEHQGKFPETRSDLQKLPGIGPYTSAAIAAIAFGKPETVVDGNVERVMSRLFRVKAPLPKAKGALTELAETLTPNARAGDYAQAVMDLGATICTPKSPACSLCPWCLNCLASAAGVAEDYPKKEPKKPKPTRFGIAYVARRSDGAWLMERRPDKGLLGGMLSWPGSDWTTSPAPARPFDADWSETGVEVRHTFTHFHLILRVETASAGPDCIPDRGFFLEKHAFRSDALPTVMRKVYAAAHNHLI